MTENRNKNGIMRLKNQAWSSLKTRQKASLDYRLSKNQGWPKNVSLDLKGSIKWFFFLLFFRIGRCFRSLQPIVSSSKWFDENPKLAVSDFSSKCELVPRRFQVCKYQTLLLALPSFFVLWSEYQVENLPDI